MLLHQGARILSDAGLKPRIPPATLHEKATYAAGAAGLWKTCKQCLVAVTVPDSGFKPQGAPVVGGAATGPGGHRPAWWMARNSASVPARSSRQCTTSQQASTDMATGRSAGHVDGSAQGDFRRGHHEKQVTCAGASRLQKLLKCECHRVRGRVGVLWACMVQKSG
jgi:hypothetical protein